MNPASTVYGYDSLDRLVTVEQPFGGSGGGTVITSYSYDVQDHLEQVADGEGTVTTYVYSDRDLMTRETSEVSGVTDYTYTESGQLETKTDARGITETRIYDALDRATLVDFPDDTLDISYTWDDLALPFGVGRLAAITRDGHTVGYDYDRFGRTIQDGELSYGYDANSNRSAIGYPGGAMSSYAFDYADREASLDYDDGSGGVQSIVTAASYLPSGPLDGLMLGNGLEEIRPHDSRYYPDAIRVNNGVADLLHWDYAVDGVGNPTSIVDVLDSANDRTYAYQDYQYFLTQGDGPWGARAWSYDRIGNRLTEQQDGGFLDNYSYQPNAGASGNSPTLGQITISGGLRTFQYDAAGNQTQVAEGAYVIDRTYDDAGRLSRQERASANSASGFLYDGRSFLRNADGLGPVAPGIGIFCDGFESGDTTAWGSGGGGVCLESDRTSPIYDSSGLLHSVDGTEILYLAGRPVAQVKTTPLFLTSDHLGTPIQATDGAMAPSWEGGFEPFGADYAEAQAAGVFLRFLGQWSGDSWGNSSEGDPLSYNLFRWYSQTSSRYTRVDPVFFAQAHHHTASLARQSGVMNPLGETMLPTLIPTEGVYSYVASSPLVFTDPFGEQAFGQCLKDCVLKVTGLETLLGGGLVAAGLPVVPKRFASKGTSKRTSVASKFLSQRFRQKFPVPMRAPTLVRPTSKTIFVGRFLGRWVPVVGWAFLAADGIQVGVCTHECVQDCG